MSDIKRSDSKTDAQHGDVQSVAAAICPPCPVCGAETVLMRDHKAVDVVTNVFRCTTCDVQYPVMKGGVVP